MEEELKNIKKIIKKLNIEEKNIKSIEIRWQPVLHDRAFPYIKIEFK